MSAGIELPVSAGMQYLCMCWYTVACVCAGIELLVSAGIELPVSAGMQYLCMCWYTVACVCAGMP